MKLILHSKPLAGESFMIDGVKFTVLESDKYLELSVDAKEASETFRDSRSTFSKE
jgi:hypothetical protein